MKLQLIIACVLPLLISLASAVDIPTTRSLHQECSQNMVCADGLYCRREPNAVYGTCEDPAHI
ncbi:hypothetical protein BDF21DRAFT_494037 [Thamnidium elegans]|uniref:Uncharacterized protein n=1 Tax=Thamnidium elegans TaxID=101142 RepID=A0A8H7VXE4_9FUNG|nr:hypothetical protein INT48_007009 [Thamnidium elegans]KAI8079456.1 hypothetical protein BDF21DRAFT_494037 [Thamnidium elegans]